ncbi:solute carrier family 25 member 16-like isoform X2 [Dermacentor variabilis]|uniref:solute carrier family 25 member 16-like isoform X2 n=1 Tax=Dermacentor variabilis TaxID=34621 RepID=UPI003F5B9D7D
MSDKTELRSPNFLLKSFFAGGVAGMCAKTTVAPLDRIKILLQGHQCHYKHYGVFSGLKGIVQKEQFLGLYKGNGAQMVRIFPYAAVQFLSFEAYKRVIRNTFENTSHASKFVAGSCAGVTAAVTTYPLDMVRARLAFQVNGHHIYNGIFHVVTSIVKTEGGVRALYKGLSPTVLGMVPYAGLSFYVFERLKAFCLEVFPNTCGRPYPGNTGGIVLVVPAKLLCGGFAGAIAQTFSKSLFSTLALTFHEHGISRGLYRGMSVNYLRAIPMVAVSFSTYEVTKQLLGLDTGLDS